MLRDGQIIFKPEGIYPDRSPPKVDGQNGPAFESRDSSQNIRFEEDVKRHVEEAIQEHLKEEEKQKQKFDQLVEKSRRILLKINSVFPFDFFPDEVTIDANQVMVINREFWGSERRHSIFIKNITDVFVDTGPFFATLKIVDRGYVENTIVVKFLKREEAKRARRIIQGLVIACSQDIDLSKLDESDLLHKVELLGRGK